VIDENLAREILAKISKYLENLCKRDQPIILSEKPRPRWIKIAKAHYKGVHHILLIFAGKDKEEVDQITDDLIELGEKYFADEKELVKRYDFTVEKF